MTDEIAGPKAGGAFITVREHLSHLVIVTKVTKVEKRFDQKRKEEGEVLTLDFHCFNCEGSADPEEKLLGHPHVASKVQRDGRLTLGYITQLPAKPGFEDGAFVLSDPRPEDFPHVQQWWEAVKAKQFAGPAATPAPAVQTPAASPWDSGPPPGGVAAAQAPWGAPAAPAPASSPGAAWGTTAPPAAAPAVVAAPPSAPTPPAAQAVPTPQQIAEMPLVSVQAIIAQGILTRDQVLTVRNDV